MYTLIGTYARGPQAGRTVSEDFPSKRKALSVGRDQLFARQWSSFELTWCEEESGVFDCAQSEIYSLISERTYGLMGFDVSVPIFRMEALS